MKRYFIHTFGCQMNVSDSSRIGEALGRLGLSFTPTAENADVIVLNTCSIREKPEDKMFSALGRYRAVKLARGALIAVGGCVAQQEKERIIKKAPYVDVVFGPDAIAKLPELIERVRRDRVKAVETAWVDSEEYVFPRADPRSARGKVTEFVTVMKGCDNVCSFCVVPHTRGREVSRPFGEVLAEVADLVAVGVREVTLIGQNVNSYRGGRSFASLLREVAAVDGIERVRFTTSHPHDLSDELIEAFRTEKKIAPHFHLPIQCGVDSLLAKMRRDYTVEGYLERLGALRAARPGIAVTTDIIVGFPGETESDFEQTLLLTDRVRFENQYSFIFSPRPKTAAGAHEEEWGPVPHEVKVERLERLQVRQRRISGEIMAASLGQEVEVLVEGPSRLDAKRRFGRTPENRTVNFDGDAAAGALVRVKVEHTSPSALRGVQGELLSAPRVRVEEPAPLAEACAG
ncbi:MAG: tRNA (N6-isopentenyl adenosine(37)-C2)-methylthiotransferase MiaB [Myxococcaceae bacterium]